MEVFNLTVTTDDGQEITINKDSKALFKLGREGEKLFRELTKDKFAFSFEEGTKYHKRDETEAKKSDYDIAWNIDKATGDRIFSIPAEGANSELPIFKDFKCNERVAVDLSRVYRKEIRDLRRGKTFINGRPVTDYILREGTLLEYQPFTEVIRQPLTSYHGYSWSGMSKQHGGEHFKEPGRGYPYFKDANDNGEYDEHEEIVYWPQSYLVVEGYEMLKSYPYFKDTDPTGEYEMSEYSTIIYKYQPDLSIKGYRPLKSNRIVDRVRVLQGQLDEIDETLTKINEALENKGIDPENPLSVQPEDHLVETPESIETTPTRWFTPIINFFKSLIAFFTESETEETASQRVEDQPEFDRKKHILLTKHQKLSKEKARFETGIEQLKSEAEPIELITGILMTTKAGKNIADKTQKNGVMVVRKDDETAYYVPLDMDDELY
ncbi:MAG: hypothetical protein KAR31_01330, partial [Candidatus Omnitrophica bacterium]|nr:hypothetical protein [Candidatus Omnitrophota bacterium]